ncbi:MAG TPA: bifunctional serine/threonine-protein kinase/formylglycine-generating enzyme family protein [Anaerolineae bacterium]|nr:bifunctional serine/threonine-protein kinase/formylglycine-generating enzyme family protein [Anaerolineae bacterium]
MDKIDRYVLKRKLGEGGMAEVYEGVDPKFGRRVAVKVLPSLAGMTAGRAEEFRKRFDKEAKVIALLEHDGIVPVYDYGGGERPFLVMRYMSRGSLRERLDQGTIAISELVSLVERLAGGLDVAHSRGVIHRDLKPANVLFDEWGKGQLADFGIAKLAEGTTITEGLVGTPAYMSPEQCRGEDLDGRSDVYSLAVMVYEMLAGERPFEANTAVGYLTKHITEPAPKLVGVNEQVALVVAKGLAKRREERWQTATELAVALRRAVEEADGSRGRMAEQAGGVVSAPETVDLGERDRMRGKEVLVEQEKRGPRRGWWGMMALTIVIVTGLYIGQMLGGGGDGEEGDGIEEIVATLRSQSALEEERRATFEAITTIELVVEKATVAATATAEAEPVAGEVRYFTLPTGQEVATVWVPAGEFMMGSDVSGLEDEAPMHLVYVDGYWLDQTEVTNRMFADFVASNDYETTAEGYGYSNIFAFDGEGWGQVTGAFWDSPEGVGSGIVGRGNYPVVHVSWYDADAYCEWAGGRLPTEAEWEKGARGEDGRVWPWGNAFAGRRLNYCDSNCRSNWSDVSRDDGQVRSAPVGIFPEGSSPYGALDMGGNVWEWTNDWYAADYYMREVYDNPEGPASGDVKVLHGGSWLAIVEDARGAARDTLAPFGSSDDIGFRCVRDGFIRE